MSWPVLFTQRSDALSLSLSLSMSLSGTFTRELESTALHQQRCPHES